MIPCPNICLVSGKRKAKSFLEQWCKSYKNFLYSKKFQPENSAKFVEFALLSISGPQVF